MSRPDGPTLGEALAAYHQANGFEGDAMYAETIQLKVLGEVVDLPNPRFQRPLLARHDLHHVLTGYGTDLRGEAEMGAWEIGAGPGHWFVWLNNVGALFLGALCPIRTARAFARGLRARSLYREPIDYDALLETPLEDVQRRLRIKPLDD